MSSAVSSWQNLTDLAGLSPSPRQGAAEAFDAAPGADYLVLYGGEGTSGLLQDTWIYQNGVWRNDTSIACASACPPRLAYASMAYDPATQSVVLVGGLTSGCPTSCNESVSDATYLWTGGSWASSTAGPYYAFDISLAWDQVDNCLLAFGGTSPSGPASSGLGNGETACFNATNSTWTVLNTATSAPPERWGAAMTNTSTGIDLVFGGLSPAGPLNDTWEFYRGGWYRVTVGDASPPARAYDALTESPAAGLGIPLPNDSAVLFLGRSTTSVLGDTWLFSGSPPAAGQAFGNWTSDTSQPSPLAAWGPAAATDLANSSVIAFGGAVAGHDLSQTWAYFHPVVVVSSSANEFRATRSATFTARAAGGLPPYAYTWTGLPIGCVGNDSAVLACTPTSGFGIYHVGVEVVDSHGRNASTVMVIQVDPASTVLTISSKYAGYFYTGIGLNDTFGVSSSIWGLPPVAVTGTLPGSSVEFMDQSGVWNDSSEMGNVTPGSSLEVSVEYSNWTIHGTLPIAMIETPEWMRSMVEFPGGILLFQSQGTGPWNLSYEFAEEMGWSLASLIAFSIPVPGFSGSYSLLPTSLVYYNFTSTGTAGLAGQLSSDPSLTFGPVTLSASIPGLKFSSSIDVTGTFTLQALGPGVSTIDWVSASASISISAEADFTINIFPAATPEGSLGLSAVISVSPSVMLTVVLGPGTSNDSNFLPGLSIVLKDLLVQLGVQVGITIQFGVDDLFEIGATGTLGLAVLFQTLQPHLAGVWVNASVSGFVQFLCFSVSFDLWSGNLYTWTADPPAVPAIARPGVDPATVFVPWSFAPRYYNGSAYNRVVYDPSHLNGTAVEDVYPNAAPSLTGTGSGATIAYTYDNVEVNESTSLGVRGYAFDPLNRTFTPLSVPAVPGSISFSPQVLGLPNASSVAVFSSVPVSEISTRIPADVGGFDLETTFGSGSAWSTPRELQGWGYPLSYALDVCGASGDPAAAVLVAPAVDPNSSTPERLIVYDLNSGGIESNTSVVGLTDLGGFECAGGWVAGTSTDGNVSLYSTSTGLPIVVNVLAPAGSSLIGASPVGGAPGDATLLYRGPTGEQAILFALESESSLAVASLPENVTGVRAFWEGGGFYLFAGTPEGILPYHFDRNGSATELATIPSSGMQQFSVARTPYGFVVLSVPTTGGTLAPRENFSLSYLAVQTPPAPSVAPTSGSVCRYAGLPCLLAELVSGGALGVLVLGGIVIFYRSRRPGEVRSPSSTPSSSSPSPASPDSPSGDPGRVP